MRRKHHDVAPTANHIGQHSKRRMTKIVDRTDKILWGERIFRKPRAMGLPIPF